MARFQIVNSVEDAKQEGWKLALQWGRYIYDDGKMEHGYRFIWLRPDGKLQPARGQARLPSLKDATALMEKAKGEGWGDYTDKM